MPRRYSYSGVPEEPGYYVYELWAGLVCLYVGRVGNSGPGLMYRRLAGHRTDKPWWPDVTDIMVSAFGSHEEVAAEEPRRIFELQPVYNRTYATRCKRGHAKPPFVKDGNYGGYTGCRQCAEERLRSPEYQAWAREYNQRRGRELTESGYWRSEEFRAAQAEYRSRPGVQEHLKAYYGAYNARPERKTKERAREAGHARRGYYATRNALPEVKDRKKRWALKASRRPGPGQAGLF